MLRSTCLRSLCQSSVFQALACTTLLAPALHGDILTVGPDAGSYDFTDIQAAVDAAVSGDTVQIAPGIYEGFSMLSKSVSVIGAGSDQTVLRARSGLIGTEEQWLSTVSIWDVIDQPVTIGGFRIAPLDPGLYEGAYGLNLDRTAVPLYLFDIEVVIDRPLLARKQQFRAPFMQFLVFDAVYSNCRTKIVPGWEPWAIENPGDYKGLPGCFILDGDAWLSDCSFQGLPGPVCGDDEPDTLFGDFALSAGPGLIHDTGELTLANCQLIGADGAAAAGKCIATAGAPGLWRRPGQFGSFVTRVHGGAGNSIRGGFGETSPGPAIQLDGPDDVTWGAGVELLPGNDAFGNPGLTLVTTDTGQGISVDDHLPSLGLSDPLGELGSSTQIRLYGDRFGVAFVRWSTGGVAPYTLPNIQGDGFIDLNTMGELPTVVLDANGEGALSIQVPNDPALLDHWYVIQMVEYDGDLEFAPPVTLGLRP